LAGTVFEVDQQTVRLKTDEAACVIPLSAIQVVWESKKHDLIEESSYQAKAFEGRAAGGGTHGGGTHGGAGGHYGGGYPAGGPGYGYPGVGRPGLPCSDQFAHNCYQTFNQNPCFQLFAAASCGTPYYLQCGQLFVQSCSTPFVMQCSTAFASY
jgi:hypothetical protein